MAADIKAFDMKYKCLGKTETKIPVIGQGCMGIGGYLSKDSERDLDYIDALRLGINLGMTLIDTAEGYGSGHSEEIVGKAIKGKRNRVFIATKVAPEHLSYNDVLVSAENSLRRLNTDYIDLYQVHWPNPSVPIHQTMQAMEKLQKHGKIRHIGVCNFSLQEFKEAEQVLSDTPLVSIQLEYNLFDQTIEGDILPYCEKSRTTAIAYSPLDQGRICSGEERISALMRIAQKYEKTIAQIALNWIVTHPALIVIPKAINSAHIKANAASADFELAQDDYEKIDRLFSQDTIQILPDRIRVVLGGQGNRKAYQTVEEARENSLGFVPSPSELAENIKGGDVLKPVRVIRSSDVTGRYDFDLIEGRIRYWAWVIAFGNEKPIPLYVREN